MKITYRTYNLPFRYPFTISKGSKTHQPTFVVQLDHFGLKGYGEAPEISYYNIPTEQMISDLERNKKVIEQFSFHDPERFWHFLHHLLPQNHFLVCALDMAGWDIHGQLKKRPLYRLWNLNMAHSPVTDYTIAIDSVEMMVRKMEEKPWPVYKIKVGFDNDVEVITELRKHSTSVFRVDANAAWSLEEALQKIPILKDLGVELVEQPLAKDNWDGMKVLYEKSSLPLFADESCVSPADVAACAGCFHGINIKLTKCGGITPARKMIERARELKLKVMIGCMNESSVGSAAIAHLSPLTDLLDMDGPLLLDEDIARGLSYHEGKIELSEQPGLGIKLNEEW